MVTMAESAENWHNMHTHMDRMHSLTRLHQHSYDSSATVVTVSACWGFSCSRNPPNSDMGCKIFNVRTWSFLCARIHTRVRHTDTKSSQHFDLGGKKTDNFFLCSWRGSNLRSLDLESDAVPNFEPPCHPIFYFCNYCQEKQNWLKVL